MEAYSIRVKKVSLVTGKRVACSWHVLLSFDIKTHKGIVKMNIRALFNIKYLIKGFKFNMSPHVELDAAVV